MRYKEWKLMKESLAGVGVTALGLSNPHSLGGAVSQFREMDDDLMDDEDEFDDEEEDGFDDEDDMDAEEDLEASLMGDDEDLGPEMDFPPDESEEMDGMPTPDEEMLDGDEEMDGVLGDIDPELAGLGDEDELGIEDELMGLDGEEELGDEEEMMMLDDEEEMGDEEDFDVDVEDDMDMEGDEADFMDRMADYCGKYMADHMAKRSRKFMHKDGGKKKGRKGKGQDDGIHSREDMTNMADNHFGKKSHMRKESVGTHGETQDQFLNTLRGAAKGDHTTQGWSGLSEELLLQMDDPNATFASEDEPQAGEVGFSPQGRVGGIGGGYTQDDIADIATMPY